MRVFDPPSLLEARADTGRAFLRGAHCGVSCPSAMQGPPLVGGPSQGGGTDSQQRTIGATSPLPVPQALLAPLPSSGYSGGLGPEPGTVMTQFVTARGELVRAVPGSFQVVGQYCEPIAFAPGQVGSGPRTLGSDELPMPPPFVSTLPS